MIAEDLKAICKIQLAIKSLTPDGTTEIEEVDIFEVVQTKCNDLGGVAYAAEESVRDCA